MSVGAIHTEIERKFLVRSEDFRSAVTESHRIAQGYIAHDGGNTVRIRIRDDRGILTIKGPFQGLGRPEWETEVSLQDARSLMQLARTGRIEKIRHIVPASRSSQSCQPEQSSHSEQPSHSGQSSHSGEPCHSEQPCHSGLVPESNRFWEIDEFLGDNEGLILAEIELGSEDEAFERPDWLGEEVTFDKRYYNSFLSKYPFKTW